MKIFCVFFLIVLFFVVCGLCVVDKVKVMVIYEFDVFCLFEMIVILWS